jgi:hypothetical protein
VLHQHAGDLRGEAAALANLGLIWEARGEAARAAALWEESLAIRRRIGDLGGAAHVMTLLGSVAIDHGAYTRARELFHESLALRQQIGDIDGIAPLFDGVAAIRAAHGDLIPAVQLAGAADALRAATGVPASARDRTAHDRLLANLRDRLTAERLAQAWSAGQVLPLEQAMATP